MQSRKTLLRLCVLCLFFVGYAAVPQNPQTRPAPGGGSQGGNRPGQPGGGNGNRPNPGRPNPGGPQIQPVRPNPGGGGNNRPQPSRPNPGGGNNRPQPNRPGRPPVRPPNRPGPGRPPQWGRPPASRPSYGWRPNDRAWLHRYYARNLISINLGNRPRFTVGGFFPFAYIPYLTPAPPAVYSYLPPPPPGYQMGYYDGYVVVYDPATYFIANVIDLLEQ